MATTPPKGTNLFGGNSPAGSGANNDGVGVGGGSLASGKKAEDASASAAASWFEEDDERLLSRLLLHDDEVGDDAVGGVGGLDAALGRLRDRLERDLSRSDADGGIGGHDGGGGGWWNSVAGSASSSGFACDRASSPSSTGTGAPDAGGGKKELPRAFDTPGGRAHVAALADLLGIGRERAVRITLSSLRSFAASSSAGGGRGDVPPSADSDKENDGDGDDAKKQEAEEQDAKLRSLLGTEALFRRVLLRHRRQFLARIRVVAESLRLEQESRGGEGGESSSSPSPGGAGGVGGSCARFLDGIDSKLSVNGRRRGLFRMLLGLAAGPPLPGMGGGGGEMPRSASLLRRGGGGGGADLGGPGEGEESLLAIRAEASEALLVLLYDRINGGVRRVDLFMVLEAAARCRELEFGTAAGGWPGPTTDPPGAGAGGTSTSPAASMARTRSRLDGLWALICAECMGLWRANGGDGSGWVERHPLFSGLNPAAALNGAGATPSGGNQGPVPSLNIGGNGGGTAAGDLDGRARAELGALCQRLRSLGETARDRRRVAYNARRRRDGGGAGGDAEEDGELWGVRAPESVALLAFGLLARLADMSRGGSTSGGYLAELGALGSECARMANDECGAFAYLHRTLEQMVLDPLRDAPGGGGNLRMIENDELVRNMWKRGEIEISAEDKSLALMDGGTRDGDESDHDSEGGLAASDAASVVYASIGREILSATVRAFRDALLSLQTRSSAVENIGMLSDLASVIYRNERILCESFWLDWDDFCQGNEDMNDGEGSNDEPMCYLLDASHTLAVSTLDELRNTGGGSQQEIIHYLKPLSTFLHLIASLCASSSMVQSVLTSEFLPEGLVSSVLSVVAALGNALMPLVSSPTEAIVGQVTPEDRSTIRYATASFQSISTLAYLGGVRARAWVRQSLVPCGSSSAAGARTLCSLASQLLPRHQNSLERECSALSFTALRLLADLLADADIVFQMEVCACFSLSPTSSFLRDSSKMSGFAPFVRGGAQSEITLGAMSVLNCLTLNLTRNAFDPMTASSGTFPAHIETIGGGIIMALDVLSTLSSSGEVSFPASKMQVAISHTIISSAAAVLVSLKQVIYLHEDDEVRSVALAVRRDIVGALSSSTPLGQVIASMATAPVALSLTQKVSNSRELSRVMDSAVHYVESKQEDSKFGAWGRFVTPKRASQRASKKRAGAKKSTASISEEDLFDNGKDEMYSGLYDVVVMSLSLLLAWGEHAEDIASLPALAESSGRDDQDVLLGNSPCTLLLSRSSPSSLQPHHALGMGIANLDLISRYASVDAVLVGDVRCNAALLSSKIVKMCLRHANVASYTPQLSIGLSAFRVALGGGTHMFKVLLGAFDKILDTKDRSGRDISFERMEQLVLMSSIILEAVAVSVSSQPDLARSMFLGSESIKDWRLVDKIVSCLMSTSELMNAMRANESVVDAGVLDLRCSLTCACLSVVSELWKSCRLSCKRNSNLDSVHACGVVASYLTNANNKIGGTPTLVANLTVELTRCALLSIMSLEEKNSLCDEISTSVVNRKCMLLDILAGSLDIITKESVSRVQEQSQGGIKFVDDLFDTGPLECWKVLLSSGDAASSAASSWLSGVTSFIGRDTVPNWNIASFLQANPAEEEISTSAWCSFGSATRLAKALTPRDANSAIITSFKQCNALHVLAKGETSFAASWATFFEVITADVIATRSSKEAHALTAVLAEVALVALSSVSESNMIAESLLSSQGLLESRDTKPIGELVSLLLYSLTAKKNLTAGEYDAQGNCQTILEMMGRLFESTNRIFAMTQLGSASPSNQESVCLIRQQLLTSALVLISEFEKPSQEGRSRDDIVKYNDLRIGFTDIAVCAMQSLQYVQLGADGAVVDEDSLAPTKYGYSFGAMSENSSDTSSSGREAAFQLLRTSLSLLSRLAPTAAGSSSSNPSEYQTYSYGCDFAACLKERNSFAFIENHLVAASNVASLTYQAVHAGSSTHSVATIHNNAADVVHIVTTFFHALTDSGSTVVDILLLLMENRCFQSLIDTSLLKTSSKIWTSSASMGDGAVSAATHHRGYYTSLPNQTDNMLSSSKGKPSSREDSVHLIWRDTIKVFSSLLRSARCQAQTYARVDEPILRQLIPVTSVVLDFVSAYEHTLFSCFTSMESEARAQNNNFSSRGRKSRSSSFSSSIQSSSFAFTSILLKEASDISSLFAELCKRNNKNELARQCSGIYDKILTTSLELTKITSSFLGSLGNARELFLALSSASGTLSNPAAMYEAHPLLAEGIPNARHEAIRNAHFAHSCCMLATAQDFTNSHTATTKAAETNENDKSLEQSFQIQVNNKFIAEVEQVAGYCLFNVLTILSDTHPASDSFISFSTEEASRLDVAAVIKSGTMVAICSQTGAHQYLQRYCIQSHGGDMKYARAVGCDRSTRTISVEYVDSGTVERHVPWSSIVGMEDTSKMQSLFFYSPTPSVADADNRGPPSLGHLILALKWCRHVGLSSLGPSANHSPMHLVKCVAERAAILLCTEVLLHDERREGLSHNDIVRKINMQLLDLFDYAATDSAGEPNPQAAVSNRGDKGLALAIGEDIFGTVQKCLKRQLQAACLEREEELKMWEQSNSGWDNTSFWGTKRQGRRSPFRLARKSSGDLS